MTTKGKLKLELDKLKAIVENETNVSNILENTRKRYVVDARCIFYKYAKEYLKVSVGELGLYSKQDHSTVSIAISRFDEVYRFDKLFVAKWEAVLEVANSKSKRYMASKLLDTINLEGDELLECLELFIKIINKKKIKKHLNEQ